MRSRTHHRPEQRGFTLLEIMIVVVIIGILVIGAILTLGATGRDSGLQQESDRLSALIAYTRERGAMLTLEYGIRCGQHGYRFVFYDNRLMRWSPELVDETLRPRQLPSGLGLDLQIEGRPIVLDDKALKVNPQSAVPPGGTPSMFGSSSGTLGGSSGSGSGSGGGSGLSTNTDDNSPQIMLFSNGDTNTFILTMQREGVGRSVTFQSSDDGTVKVGDIKDIKDTKEVQQ